MNDTRRALELIQRDHELIELRALPPFDGWQSGIFDDRERLVHAVADLTWLGADVYWSHNRLHPQPATNRLSPGRGIRNRSVASISNIFIDIDPLYPGGANDVAIAVADWLLPKWGEPIRISSGRGRYLFYPVDDIHPAHVTAIKSAVANLKSLFDCDAAIIDAKCTNVGRISRVPGSENQKSKAPTECRILDWPKLKT